MIILRTPKGWTAPAEIDRHKVEGSWRSHQVPIADPASNPAHLQLVERWLRSYHPEQMFDVCGRLLENLRALAPSGARRMSANPVANGGLLRKSLRRPDFREYGVSNFKPAVLEKENTPPLGRFLRDTIRLNPTNFRVFGPKLLRQLRYCASNFPI